MDTFTATASPNQIQSPEMIKKPSSHFRLIFLLLLIAALLSAAATTFILLTKTPPPPPVVETIAPNPFDEPLSDNPLNVDETQTASAEGMFDETSTDNFFSQFGDGATESSEVNQNPF